MTSAERVEAADRSHRGRTKLSSRALHHLAVGIVKDAALLDKGNVSVTISDDSGAFRVSVLIPASIMSPIVPIPEQSERVRSQVISGMGELAGRRVGAVDVRFAGVHRAKAERRAV